MKTQPAISSEQYGPTWVGWLIESVTNWQPSVRVMFVYCRRQKLPAPPASVSLTKARQYVLFEIAPKHDWKLLHLATTRLTQVVLQRIHVIHLKVLRTAAAMEARPHHVCARLANATRVSSTVSHITGIGGFHINVYEIITTHMRHHRRNRRIYKNPLTICGINSNREIVSRIRALRPRMHTGLKSSEALLWSHPQQTFEEFLRCR
mmetsp:Transcript_71143/g.126128  ORF Transcript_71143/g.126128 Transcript_71143/m.126128 type:complete len:206 (+) Transcript_71143:151-768(+)